MKIVNRISIIMIVILPTIAPINSIFAIQDKDMAKKGVVKLNVYQEDAIETGAGIVLSIRQNVLFILTAYHVIDEADSIIVQFYDSPALQMKAQAYERIDRDKDLAVLYVRNYQDPAAAIPLYLGDISKIKELDEVVALGHPGNFEWEPSAGNFRTLDPSNHLIRFEGITIDFGNSGGPLLNKDFELIGMVTKKLAQYGYALEINHAIEILRNWTVPVDLQPRPLDEGGRKKWWWIGGGVTVVGGTVLYFLTRPDKVTNGLKLLPKPENPPNN
jgi:S1-C subfamily serine protease